MFGKKKKTCMEREIYAQSKILEEVLESYVKNDSIDIDIPKGIERVIIVASGSSYNCARYMADLFGNLAKMEAQAVYSSEFLLEQAIAHNENILYVFITQSGETTDTNHALEKAKEFGVKTLSITNQENSTIWNGTDYQVACLAGVEHSIAATKSFTSQLLCSTLLVLKFAQNKGFDISGKLADLKTIPAYIGKAVALREEIKKFAKFISKYKSIIMTADGSSYALAKEAALKIKETSYINTSSYILGEFLHGHVAVLNNKRSALVYVLNDELSYTAIKNLSTIKETYNPPICIIGNRSSQVKYSFNFDIQCDVPIVKTFVIVLIIQLIALETALKLGRNIDKPKGLNKVVK